MAPKYQTFNGVKFCRDDKTGYYNCSTLRESMHTYIWKYYNGDIPEGYEIHHKDRDKSNNDISNLEMLECHEHRKLHGRLLTDEEREWRRNNIEEKARPKAIEWHKSEEGKQWHKEQALYRKDSRREIVNVCNQCGKEFITFAVQGRKFCSGACEQKYRRQNGLNNTEAVCCVCGKTFITDKYSPRKTCSKSCAGKLCHLTAPEKYKGKRKGN